jgi:hypothetical protein
VQQKASKFANHKKESAWETLAQLGKVARICDLFKHTPENGHGKLWGQVTWSMLLLNREMIGKLRVGHKQQRLGNILLSVEP